MCIVEWCRKQEKVEYGVELMITEKRASQAKLGQARPDQARLG